MFPWVVRVFATMRGIGPDQRPYRQSIAILMTSGEHCGTDHDQLCQFAKP